MYNLFIFLTSLFSIVAIAWAKNWEGNVIATASSYITSAFNSMNLAALLNVVLYVLETVLLPFYAKFADMVGRTEAFVISIFFYVLSGVVQAVAPNMDTLVVSLFFFIIKKVPLIIFFFLGRSSHLCLGHHRCVHSRPRSYCR